MILLGNPSSALHAGVLRETQNAARALHLRLATLDASNADEIEIALRGLQRDSADAFLVSSEVLFLANKAKIARSSHQSKAPSDIPLGRLSRRRRVDVLRGESQRSRATDGGYVDRILKGAKPAEMPIEQMSKYELVIDLRVAARWDSRCRRTFCCARTR